MLHIQVGPSDIESGIRADAEACPIKLALTRVCPTASMAAVECYSVYRSLQDSRDACGTGEHGIDCITLPQEAVQFIAQFDFDGNAEPFEFDLDVDCDWFKPLPVEPEQEPSHG